MYCIHSRRVVYLPNQIMSGGWFDGWLETPPLTTEAWVQPQTWLLRVGWQKHGRIGVSEAPKA